VPSVAAQPVVSRRVFTVRNERMLSERRRGRSGDQTPPLVQRLMVGLGFGGKWGGGGWGGVGGGKRNGIP